MTVMEAPSVREMLETAEELIKRGREMVALGISIREQNGYRSTPEIGRILPPLGDGLPKPAAPPAPPVEEPVELPPEVLERTVGRFGAITEPLALRHVQDLGEFRKSQFAKKAGLKPAACNRWLNDFIERGILAYRGGQYRCVNPPTLRDWVSWQEEPFAPEDAAKRCGMSPADVMTKLEDLEDNGTITQVGTSGLFEFVHPESRGAHSRPKVTPPEQALVESRSASTQVRLRKVNKRATSIPGQGHRIRQRDKRYNALQEAKATRDPKAA